MIRTIAALASLLAAATGALAQGPLSTAFTYQGELRSSGSPVTGLYDLRFRLYDAPAAGTQLGSTLCADNIPVSNGRFTLSLDFGAQFTGQQTFLEIEVRQDTGLDCSNSAGFTTLGQRQPLTAAPYAEYALNAANAVQLNGQAPSFYQNAANLASGTIPSARLSGAYSGALTLSSASNSFTGSGAGLNSLNASSIASGTLADARLSTNIPKLNTINAFGNFTNTFLGNVGIGTAAPGMKLTVAGDMELGTSSGDYRRFRIGGGNSDGFLYGSYPGLGDGIHMGYNWYADAGGAGQVVNAGGQTSRISAGYGYIGLATADVNQAPRNRIVISSDGTTQFFPGFGSSPLMTIRPGSVGIGADTNGAALRVACSSDTAISAEQHNQTVGQWAIYGWTDGPYCIGVVGLSSLSTGYAMFSSGRFGASGTKSFRIDHPADPENKYLLHYCAESPEAINFYRGTVTLDSAGNARVDLPSYFARINKDPSYQLTAVGAPMPLLHVSRKIDAADLATGNAAAPDDPIQAVSFLIGGGAPGGEVSWRVEAARNDRWIQRYGAPVETDKPDFERGKYQHPELYNQPAEAGVFPTTPRINSHAPRASAATQGR